MAVCARLFFAGDDVLRVVRHDVPLDDACPVRFAEARPFVGDLRALLSRAEDFRPLAVPAL